MNQTVETLTHYDQKLVPENYGSIPQRNDDEPPFLFQEFSIKLKDGTKKILDENNLEENSNHRNSNFKKYLTEIHLNFHSPPYENFKIFITSGCQGALYTVLKTMNPSNLPVLVPKYCYSDTSLCISAYNKLILIDQNDDGLSPEDLLEKLENYQEMCHKNPDIFMPRLLYVNPTGSNPTGQNISLENRKKIYKIACDFNLYIIEDDPYYHLTYDEEPIVSFQSLDIEERVIRFDSISKVMFPGVRFGWISGPGHLIDKIEARFQNTLMTPSTITQAIIEEIFSHWKISGYMQHVQLIRNFYRERRDFMLRAIEEHLTGICEWTVPKGGMFFWIQVPKLGDTSILLERGVERGVFCIPGFVFNHNQKDVDNFLRVSYSYESCENFTRGIERLGDVIREALATDNTIVQVN